MKRVSFIPGVDGMSGILASRAGKLVYPSNDNKAFDAPVGRQYARNYGSRIVLAQRKRDGLAYFMCKTKSATLVDAASKIKMAALGTIQDLKKTFKDEDITISVGGIPGTYWAYINLAYRTGIADGVIDPNISVDKWIDGQLIDMMRYRLDNITMQVERNGSRYTFNIVNPYIGPDVETLPISQRNFIKFNPTLTTLGNAPVIYINGMPVVFEGTDSETWSEMRSTVAANNPNYTAQLSPLVAEGTSSVTWNAQNLYSSTGVAQKGDTPLIVGEKYTTASV